MVISSGVANDVWLATTVLIVPPETLRSGSACLNCGIWLPAIGTCGVGNASAIAGDNKTPRQTRLFFMVGPLRGGQRLRAAACAADVPPDSREARRSVAMFLRGKLATLHARWCGLREAAAHRSRAGARLAGPRISVLRRRYGAVKTL